MNFFEKRKLKAMVQSCNFNLAGEVIQSKFGTESGQNALNDLIRQYMGNPGFEMAVKLIDFEPQLAIYFIECNPDGFYSRQMQKKMIDTQEHQAFIAHISGDSQLEAAASRQAEAVRAGLPTHKKQKQPGPETLPSRSGTAAAAAVTEKPIKPAEQAFPNVIQTLRDSVRELEQQVAECEREIAELERRDASVAELRRRWLSVCKEGVREFEGAIRVLQSLEK